MRKARLVAGREFLDIVRTRTFWIGILSFPVIVALAVLVPQWLEGAKEPRRYAVLDHSGWLADAIEQRALAPDLAKVFEALATRYREEPDTLDALPPVLRSLAPVLASLEPAQREALAETLTAIGDDRPLPPAVRDALPPEARAAVGLMREEIRRWWLGLDPAEARRLAPETARARYVRVPVEPPAGTDPLVYLNEQVRSGQLFAYFVIGPDPVSSTAGMRYVSNNLTDDELRSWYTRLATEVVRERRIAQAGIPAETARWIAEPVRFEVRKPGEAGTQEAVAVQDMLRQWAPALFTYLLWIAIFTTGQMLLTNTIEEKSNRIIEVLLSSVSPLELMAGKIVGIALAGLTVVGSWVVFVILGAKLLPHFIEGVPQIDLGLIAGDPVLLGSFVTYFLLGFLFYSALMAAIGSVCNTLKEAQNLLQPITILLMLPLLAMVPIAQDPNGTLARVLSYLPPFTPFVMMNRAAGPPSAFEYAATLALLLASTAVALWAAAKIFRVGILMTGKPPRLREILRWVRTPVTASGVRATASSEDR
ncbi:MAG: hypothetical protein D6776_06985 [Planctomycetota bacterium]|nr:MAG: hypothetical protein D6776_06985 [Planctomycetota bacterium]